ncbi:MAG: hypothetical protein ABJN84_16030 [Flavobacteriaceae bacterium]
MRIEYKILWIEDVKSWYKDNFELAEEYLDDLGFKLVSKLCKNFDEVKQEYDINKLKDYDLLLVDFTLAGSPNGDEIINFIRNQKDNPILTDVIFYSNDIQSVRDSIKKFELEGVYTTHRTDFTTKFELVVDTTIKKVQEVNSMRGLIMAETSDLDELMLTIIQKLLKSNDSEKIEQYMKTLLAEIPGNVENYLSKDINTQVQNSLYFNSLKKAKTITQLYKLKGIGQKGFAHSYDENVISTRNLFAHVTEKEENGQKVLVSHITGKEEIFNEKRCIEIRHTLIKYREILEKINTELNPKP